jgi:hypothetical protein
MPSNIWIGGTLFFKIGGVQYSLGGSFSVDIGGITREPVVGPDGVHGFNTKYRAPTWEAELLDGSAVLLATIQGIEGQTLTAELDNGKTYVMTNGYQTGDVKLDAVEAKIKANFSGTACTES